MNFDRSRRGAANIDRRSTVQQVLELLLGLPFGLTDVAWVVAFCHPSTPPASSECTARPDTASPWQQGKRVYTEAIARSHVHRYIANLTRMRAFTASSELKDDCLKKYTSSRVSMLRSGFLD